MFHLGRSGSTVLGDMLDQRPEVLWDGEIYGKVLQEWDKQGIFNDQLPPFDPLEYLRRQMVFRGKHHYGFEVNPDQLQLLKIPINGFVDALTRSGFTHFIVLERKNTLRKLISLLIAKQRQEYHQKIHQSPVLTKITLGDRISLVEPYSELLINILRMYEEQISQFKQVLAKRNTLHLVYEEHVEQDPYIAYQRICDFVGLKPYPVKIKFRKTNPYPLKDIIQNFSEVEEKLSDTPYAWMLES